MDRKKHTYIVLAIAIVIIGGAIGYKNVRGEAANKDITIAQIDLGIPIELVDVNKGDIVEDISYIGTIVPKKSSTVSSSIGGQIIEIYVEEGSMVKAGDLLAKIDDKQLSATHSTALKKIQTLNTSHNYINVEIGSFYSSSPLVKKLETLTSSYEYIKLENEKYEQLYKEGAVSKTVYEKIKQDTETVYLQMEELKATMDEAYDKLSHEKNMTQRQLEEANASINELNIKIEDTLIKAPIEGVVKTIYYDEGDLAAMGKPFADIDNNDELLVKVNITESDINKINTGNKVALKLKGMSNELITEVGKVIPNVNPSTRVGIIEIGPIKAIEGFNLVSGNSVEVSIITNEVLDRIIIPKDAIKNLNEQSIVYLYQNGIVKEINITTGLTVGENTEVIEGLKEGDKIAIKNLSKLYEDAKVYVFKGEDQ